MRQLKKFLSIGLLFAALSLLPGWGQNAATPPPPDDKTQALQAQVNDLQNRLKIIGSALSGSPVAAPAYTPATTGPAPKGSASKADFQALQAQLADLTAKYNALSTSLENQNTEIDQVNKAVQDVKAATTAPEATPGTTPAAPVPAPGGSVTADQANTIFLAETPENLANSSAGISLNIAWVLICGWLVMFMQAGFALVETGLTRAKNAAHTTAMNFVAYGVVMLGFWSVGFAFEFGGNGDPNSVGPVTTLGPAVSSVLNSEFGFHLGSKWIGLCGNSGYFLSGNAYDGGIFALFLFEMMFTDVGALIPTGAMAERWKFLPFCIFSFFVGAFIFPVYGGWVWGGGWLAALGKNFGLGHGHIDFAGSTVVHLVGGTMAFAGAVVLGPRIGKYNADGTPNPIPGHNLPMAVLGTFVLAFGWFGFNAGSTLASTDTHIGIIATNTMLASGGGIVATLILTWWRLGKPEASMCCNGMLAGQVAITGGCAFVDSWAAVLTGAIAGILMYCSVFFIEERLRVDDPAAAISVHGTCGLWGILALGLFANGKYGDGYNGVAGKVAGFFYGDPGQFMAEVVGAVSCIIFVFITAYTILMVIEKTIGNRVSEEAEIEGLDIPEMGTLGYNNDV